MPGRLPAARCLSRMVLSTSSCAGCSHTCRCEAGIWREKYTKKKQALLNPKMGSWKMSQYHLHELSGPLSTCYVVATVLGSS